MFTMQHEFFLVNAIIQSNTLTIGNLINAKKKNVNCTVLRYYSVQLLVKNEWLHLGLSVMLLTFNKCIEKRSNVPQTIFHFKLNNGV